MDFTVTFLFFALLISSTKTLDSCGSRSDNSDLSILPIYGKCSMFGPPKPDSWVNTIINMTSKDPAMVKYLSSLAAQKTTAVSIASGQKVLSIGNYVAMVRYMVLDTSTDVAWVPCSGCTCCWTTTFSSNVSSSYGSLDFSLPQCTQVCGVSCLATGAGACYFSQPYGGDSSFFANLVQDSLTFSQ